MTVGLHMDHLKSQALHADPQLPIGRESRAVPMPYWVGLSLTPCAVQGTTPGWGCHRGHNTTPLAQQQEHPPGPLTGLLHGGLCESGGSSDTREEVYETSVPSSYWQGGRETASGAQIGSVGKCANSERMSDSAPVADVSCSWLQPQVSWFMCFISMKYERCYCSSKIPTGCSFHRNTTLQPNTASFGEAQLQVIAWLILIFLLLNPTNHTSEHTR